MSDKLRKTIIDMHYINHKKYINSEKQDFAENSSSESQQFKLLCRGNCEFADYFPVYL